MFILSVGLPWWMGDVGLYQELIEEMMKLKDTECDNK